MPEAIHRNNGSESAASRPFAPLALARQHIPPSNRIKPGAATAGSRPAA